MYAASGDNGLPPDRHDGIPELNGVVCLGSCPLGSSLFMCCIQGPPWLTWGLTVVAAGRLIVTILSVIKTQWFAISGICWFSVKAQSPHGSRSMRRGLPSPRVLLLAVLTTHLTQKVELRSRPSFYCCRRSIARLVSVVIWWSQVGDQAVDLGHQLLQFFLQSVGGLHTGDGYSFPILREQPIPHLCRTGPVYCVKDWCSPSLCAFFIGLWQSILPNGLLQSYHNRLGTLYVMGVLHIQPWNWQY